VKSPFITILYYDYKTTASLEPACSQFLKDTEASPYRAFITESSDDIIFCDDFFNKQRKLNVLCFSTAASSNTLSSILTENALTYGYFNQQMIKSFFIIFSSYDVEQVVLYYDEFTTAPTYQEDLIRQMKIQAELLKIPYEIIPLSAATTTTMTSSSRSLFYSKKKNNKDLKIKKNTAIFLICETQFLSKYITPSFLEQIPSGCFIMLTDVAENAPDIFGTVPTFIAYYWPPDFNETSLAVYRNVNSLSASFEIYPMYQIIYSLAKITLLPHFFENAFSMTEYLQFNSFVNIPPPWVTADSLNLSIRGLSYGFYALLFTKNIFFQNVMDLYLQKNLGGNPTTKDSVSMFANVGIIPWTTNQFFMAYNIPYFIYDNTKNPPVIIVRNSTDTTLMEKNLDVFLSVNNNYHDNFFYYSYEETNRFFKVLTYIPKQKRKVTQSMCICNQSISR